MKPKLLAFHLPQYHPIPENDEWWGPGFTEWRNVARATSLFPGHYQPHIPADIGFYDLRLPEARQQQADLAREYGIHGFCYYHYWFSGKQLLEKPVSEILSSGKPDFPFCLCWANESWTRRWDGQDAEILIKQTYSLADDLDHLEHLISYFRDPRYIRISNKPLFLVYRASRLPNPSATTSLWRQVAKQHGFDDLFLVKVESFHSERNRDPKEDGFDASLDFQPDWGSLPSPISPPLTWRLLNKARIARPHPFRQNSVYYYPDVVSSMLSRQPCDYARFGCVTPGFDNSARRKNGGASIFIDSTPSHYGSWLRSTLADRIVMAKLPEPVVFINAWNEWAEGNHLEPDLESQLEYLNQTRNAINQYT